VFKSTSFKGRPTSFLKPRALSFADCACVFVSLRLWSNFGDSFFSVSCVAKRVWRSR